MALQGVPQMSQRGYAGYLPSAWDPELIMSSTSAYKYEDHASRLEQLKEATKTLLESTKATPQPNLTLIDELHRLGVAYHFEKEIKDDLKNLNSSLVFHDLFSVALQFRLLRQNGLSVRSEVFKKFLDNGGEFIDNLKEDAKRLLSLHEASYLGLHGETKKARDFSTKHLKSLSLEKLETSLSEQIQWSLQIPLYQRFQRLETRNFINLYQKDESKNLVLLELAKLDFNLVQSIYLEELTKWWKDWNIAENYPFARDRLVENYYFTLACVSESQFSQCRTNIAKFCSLLTILDDIYDLYGHFDELEKLTEAFTRWDPKAVEDIPEYTRPLYLAIYEHVKETAEYGSNNLGMDILPFLKERWLVNIREYMNEARWNHSGYMPTFDEYLEQGIRTIGIAVVVGYAYFGCLDLSTINKHLVQCIVRPDSEFLYLPSIFGRLYGDLETSKAEMERGRVVNSITLTMAEKGVSKDEAREHIKYVISETWIKLNDFFVRESLPTSMCDIMINVARSCQLVYAKGDWYQAECRTPNELIISLIFEPLSTEN